MFVRVSTQKKTGNIYASLTPNITNTCSPREPIPRWLLQVNSTAHDLLVVLER